MSSSWKSKKLIILVSNARIVFAERQANGGLSAVAGFELDDFIADGVGAGRFGELKARGVELLIVPDYWLGIKPLLISSTKRSVVEPYILRKLRADHPDIPDIDNFFDYVPYQGDLGHSGVQAYYFQETLFAQLSHRLEAEGLTSLRITTPGLLWERKLGQVVDSFGRAGVFLINLIGSECFFYFFHRGRYLFSRDISISEQLPFEERLDALSFEIDQSRFLFSQKAKAEIDQIYIVSAGERPIHAKELGGRLGREVQELSFPARERNGGVPDELNALTHLATGDLFPRGEFVNLAHRQLRREQQWRPVQTVGLAVGGLLLALLLGQSLFLLSSVPTGDENQLTRELKEQKQLGTKVGADVDRILVERQRLTLIAALNGLAESLPPRVSVTQASLQTDPQPALELQGEVFARDVDEFRQSLNLLTERLKSHFRGNESLTSRDIEFQTPGASGSGGDGRYQISLRVKLL